MTDVRFNKLRKLQRIEWARGLRGPHVPADDHLPYIAGLIAEGFTPTTIAEAAGVSTRTIELLIDGTHHAVSHRTARGLQRLTRTQIIAAAGDDMYIPNVGAARRIQALMVNGWSWEAIGEQSPPRFHARVLRPGQLIQAKTHRRVVDVYDRLWGTRGSSPVTARRATTRGWAPPLAWDDDTIDDPAAVPAEWRDVTWRGKPRTVRPPGVFLSDAEFLTDAGESLQGAARRLGMTPATLKEMLHSRQRQDLIQRLSCRDRAAS